MPAGCAARCASAGAALKVSGACACVAGGIVSPHPCCLAPPAPARCLPDPACMPAGCAARCPSAGTLCCVRRRRRCRPHAAHASPHPLPPGPACVCPLLACPCLSACLLCCEHPSLSQTANCSDESHAICMRHAQAVATSSSTARRGDASRRQPSHPRPVTQDPRLNMGDPRPVTQDRRPKTRDPRPRDPSPLIIIRAHARCDAGGGIERDRLVSTPE
jgi:hypothetical protein